MPSSRSSSCRTGASHRQATAGFSVAGGQAGCSVQEDTIWGFPCTALQATRAEAMLLPGRHNCPSRPSHEIHEIHASGVLARVPAALAGAVAARNRLSGTPSTTDPWQAKTRGCRSRCILPDTQPVGRGHRLAMKPPTFWLCAGKALLPALGGAMVRPLPFPLRQRRCGPWPRAAPKSCLGCRPQEVPTCHSALPTCHTLHHAPETGRITGAPR